MVIGWIWVPTFTSGESTPAVAPTSHTHQTVAIRAAKRINQTATKAYSSAKTKISNKIPESDPLPDPIHHQSTVSFQSFTESQHDHTHADISEYPTANHSAVTFSRSTTLRSAIPQSSIYPKTDGILIDLSDELGPLNRDELRLAATFNYSYLALVDDVLQALDKVICEDDEVGSSGEV